MPSSPFVTERHFSAAVKMNWLKRDRKQGKGHAPEPGEEDAEARPKEGACRAPEEDTGRQGKTQELIGDNREVCADSEVRGVPEREKARVPEKDVEAHGEERVDDHGDHEAQQVFRKKLGRTASRTKSPARGMILSRSASPS